MSLSAYENCMLCGRKCGVNRNVTTGFCGMTSGLTLARAALHKWEEPPISGSVGSGTVFLSGCSLACKFCQNTDISHGRFGKDVDIDRLVDIMLSLRDQGAHNVNFVTPTHFAPSIAEAIKRAKSRGFDLPIVYNTGSYDTPDALRLLDGLVDIYLPDFKYYTSKTAAKFSYAADYPDVARRAIAEMFRQAGEPQFDSNGLMKKGIIVRLLLLPGHTAETMLILKYLIDTYGDSIYVSLMNQYTPMPDMKPPLNRPVTREEYRRLTDYALKLGLKNGFVQDHGTAAESFIPPFDLTGI